MIFSKYTYHLLAITAPKIHTDLLWDLSFLFIGLSVIYFSIVFIHKKRLATHLQKVKQRKGKLAPMISEFLFYEEDATKEDKTHYLNLKIEIRDLIKDPFNRKILSEVLLDLQKDLSGDTQDRLFILYQDLDLHKDAFQKLKSWRWEIVSKAIQDLTRMQVSEAYSFIIKFINDKRPTIRKQAEIATVTLKDEGINYFLDSTKYKISEWQQLKLLDVIRNQKNYKPPAFSAWLTSTNNYVVLFALRLIKFYNQNNASNSLIELLKHKNAQIKLEAIACIKEFHLIEAMDTIKLIFWKSSTDVKISILDTIADLGTEEDIAFLELIDKKVSNFSVISKALSSINAISPEYVLPTKDIVDASHNTIPEDLPVAVKTSEENMEATQIEEVTGGEINDVDATNEAEQIELKPKVETDTIAISTSEKNIETDAPIEPQKEEQISSQVENISVEYEEFIGEVSFEKTEKQEPTTVDTINLDFLPLVVSKTIENQEYPLEANSSDMDTRELRVIFELVPSFGDELKADETKYSYQQLLMEDISFLPIVIENTCAEENLVSYASKDRHSELLSIDVQFEEVLAHPTNIPFSNSVQTSYKRYHTPEILELKIIYNEVVTSYSEGEDIFNFDVIDPVFLSFSIDKGNEEPMNTVFNTNTTKTETNAEMTPKDEAKFKQIINSIINLEREDNTENDQHKFEVSSSTPIIDKENTDIDFIPLVDEISTGEPTGIAENPEKENPERKAKKESDSKIQIPNAIISDQIIDTPEFKDEDSEESAMQLLDDLDEMGDHREVPLLKEMLVNVKYKTIYSRVEKLIKRFSEEEEEEVSAIVKSTENITLKPFNVFEDLFRICDTESKLILLDEVAVVGDFGDIPFLENLLDDSNNDIQEKAKRVLAELKENLGSKIDKPLETVKEHQPSTQKKVENTINESEVYRSLMNELEIETTRPSDLFDVAFDLEFSENTHEGSKDQPTNLNQDSIMSKICSFSSKIINKLNG